MNPADLIARAKELEAAAAPSAHCSTIEGQSWIVWAPFGACAFDVKPEGGKFRATCTGYTKAEKANRFSRNDAEKLADACNGEAMHWRDAYRKDAAECRRLAELLGIHA